MVKQPSSCNSTMLLSVCSPLRLAWFAVVLASCGAALLDSSSCVVRPREVDDPGGVRLTCTTWVSPSVVQAECGPERSNWTSVKA